MKSWIGVVALLFAGACKEDGSVEVTKSPSSLDATWIANVAIFDGDKMLDGRFDVLVRGTKIETITATGTAKAPPEIVDGSGKTLLPGLIDAHAHFAEGFPPWRARPPNEAAIAQSFVYAGVTTVIVAQHDPALADFRTDVAPHMYLGGPGVTAVGGHPIPLLEFILPWPVSSLIAGNVAQVSDEATARAAMKTLKEEQNLELVKIFFDDLPPGTPRLDAKLAAIALKEARAAGLRPIVHTALSADMVTAAKSGAALLMHTPFRDALTDAQIAELAATKVPFVTTARIWTALKSAADGTPRKLEEEMISQEIRTSFANRPKDHDSGPFAYLEKDGVDYNKFSRDNVVRLIRAGVPFFTGTDCGVGGVYPGAALHGEIALLVELGIPAVDVLRAATSAPAEWLDPAKSFGRIARGQRADLLLVRGDPSTDITAIDSIEEVFLDGARLRRTRR